MNLKLFTPLLTVSLAFVLAACSGEDYYASLSAEQADSSGRIEVSMGGEKIDLTISSNVNWAITTNGSWAKVNQANGNGDAVVVLTVDGNYSGVERKGTLLLSSGEMSETLEIVQRAVDFSLNTNKLVFDLEGSPQTLTVTANYSWTLTVPDDVAWCQPNVLSGEGNAVVTFTPTAYDEVMLREGSIVFTCGEITTEVPVRQQTNKLYADGTYAVCQTFSAPDASRPINIVILGDGFTESDYMHGGVFDTALEKAIDAFFCAEPYITYRDHFTVYKVVAHSEQSGATVKQDFPRYSLDDPVIRRQTRKTAFSSVFDGGESTGIDCDADAVFEYVLKIPEITEDDLPNITVILIINLDAWAGTAFMWTSGIGLAMCPTHHTQFADIVVHETTGHAFAKLGDEYVYQSETLPTEEVEHIEEFREEAGGVWEFYANLSLTPNREEVHWKHYFTKAGYEQVGMHEGGATYENGIWRPEPESAMDGDEQPFYFNAPSREAIVRRMMTISGKGFNYSEFYAKDNVRSPASATSRAARGYGMKRPPLAPPIVVRD